MFTQVEKCSLDWIMSTQPLTVWDERESNKDPLEELKYLNTPYKAGGQQPNTSINLSFTRQKPDCPSQ